MIYYVWYSKKYNCWCYSAEGWDFRKAEFKSARKAVKHLMEFRYCGEGADFSIKVGTVPQGWTAEN